MSLVLINISTFRFIPFKNFFQLLVLIKFSITTFGPYFQSLELLLLLLSPHFQRFDLVFSFRI